MIPNIIKNLLVIKSMRILTTKWEKTPAYKLGIVDSNGEKIVDTLTPEQRKEYSYYDKFIYTLKRLTHKMPGGKLATYAIFYKMLNEENMRDSINKFMLENDGQPSNNSGNIAIADMPLSKHDKRLKKLKNLIDEIMDELDESSTFKVKRRIRDGGKKVQKKHRVSAKKGFSYSNKDKKLTKIGASEKIVRARGAKLAAIKSKSKKTIKNIKRKKSMNKRAALGWE